MNQINNLKAILMQQYNQQLQEIHFNQQRIDAIQKTSITTEANGKPRELQADAKDRKTIHKFDSFDQILDSKALDDYDKASPMYFQFGDSLQLEQETIASNLEDKVLNFTGPTQG